MPTMLSPRQEAFCRHYAVSGNAAAAARKAGYAEACARQQGYENLQKPFVLIRLDEIRHGFAETAAREAAILLARLERIWRSADADDDLFAMLQTVAMQAKLSGLTGDADTKLRLWGPDGQAGPLERAAARAGDDAALAVARAAAPRDPAREDRRDAAPDTVFEPDIEPPDAHLPDPPPGVTVAEMARRGRWIDADGREIRLVTEEDEKAAARFYGLAEDDAAGGAAEADGATAAGDRTAQDASPDLPDGTLHAGPPPRRAPTRARSGDGPRIPPHGDAGGAGRRPDGTLHPEAPAARAARAAAGAAE